MHYWTIGLFSKPLDTLTLWVCRKGSSRPFNCVSQCISLPTVHSLPCSLMIVMYDQIITQQAGMTQSKSSMEKKWIAEKENEWGCECVSAGSELRCLEAMIGHHSLQSAVQVHRQEVGWVHADCTQPLVTFLRLKKKAATKHWFFRTEFFCWHFFIYFNPSQVTVSFWRVWARETER